MPFYEYECSSCKFYTEVMQKITDAPLTKCPSCGSKTLKKLVSAPVFRLKGAGWYETDFKSDKENKRNLAGAEKEDASSTAQPEAASAKPEPSTGEGAKPESAKTEASGKASKAEATSGSAKRTEPKSPPAQQTQTGRRRGGASGGPAVSRSQGEGRAARPAARASSSASKSRPAAARTKARTASRKKARR